MTSSFDRAFKEAEAVRKVGNAAKATLEQDASQRARFARSVGEPYLRSLANEVTAKLQQLGIHENGKKVIQKVSFFRRPIYQQWWNFEGYDDEDNKWNLALVEGEGFTTLYGERPTNVEALLQTITTVDLTFVREYAQRYKSLKSARFAREYLLGKTRAAPLDDHELERFRQSGILWLQSPCLFVDPGTHLLYIYHGDSQDFTDPVLEFSVYCGAYVQKRLR